MDITEKYVKMCEKADEVQKFKNEWDGDSPDFWFGTNQEVFEIAGYFYANRAFCPWLPRQEDIQAMFKRIYDVDNMIATFHSWYRGFTIDGHLNIREYKDPENKNFNTFEQLWLAFYMRDRHNKIWNGEDWIKDK